MSDTTLQRGDVLPHIEVRTVDGGRFSYVTIWQHKHLVLVVLGPGTDDTYARLSATSNSGRVGRVARVHPAAMP